MTIEELNEMLKKSESIEVDGFELRGDLCATIEVWHPLGKCLMIHGDDGSCHSIKYNEKEGIDPDLFMFFDGEVWKDSAGAIYCPFCMGTNIDEDVRVCFVCKEQF
jgi:hypothetical protein